MVAQDHQLNEHEFEQAPADSEGQRSLACCNPWSHKVGHNLATEKQQALIYNKTKYDVEGY